MSQIQKFLFDGLPVRGVVVRLTDAWQEIIQRRAASAHGGAYAEPVLHMLGEMAAGAVLMQSNIKFNGALVMQLQGSGPVKMAVAEVQANLAVRATAKVMGDVAADAGFADLVQAHGGGQCAITLDPQDRQPGQQPYQGVVPLQDAQGQPLASVAGVLQQYMRQSEQLDTTLVLAANAEVAAGILIQRLPLEGQANLAGDSAAPSPQAQAEAAAHYQHIATLAQSLQKHELLELNSWVNWLATSTGCPHRSSHRCGIATRNSCGNFPHSDSTGSAATTRRPYPTRLSLGIMTSPSRVSASATG